MKKLILCSYMLFLFFHAHAVIPGPTRMKITYSSENSTVQKRLEECMKIPDETDRKQCIDQIKKEYPGEVKETYITTRYY